MTDVWFFKRATRLGALIVIAMLTLAILPAQASAATLHAPTIGWYLQYRVNGEVLHIGVLAKDNDGNNYYCVEAGGPVSYVNGADERIPDSDAARRIAWLMQRYKHDQDPAKHAAIGILAHDHFDANPSVWAQHKAVIVQTHPQLPTMVDGLWHEAGQHAPSQGRVSSTFTQGLREGNIDVSVVNSSGNVIRGIEYSVTLQGPAQFENGESRISGVSQDHVIKHSWKATGDGTVNVAVDYNIMAMGRVLGTQDLAHPATAEQARGEALTMTVKQSFQPSLSTTVRDVVNDAEEEVVDTVTSGVQSAEDHWVPGLELQAYGWYFSLDRHQLGETVEPNSGEGAQSFLERLTRMGYRPVAYGRASFTAPGQRVEVTATTQQDGKQVYRAPESGGFGTWVWAFDRERLSEQAKQYVLKDVVSPLMEVSETNVNRKKVKVHSSVTEHSAIVGSELSDTITVSGFPDDHGSFLGDARFGFEADNAESQVSVWWSGDAADPSNDAKYRPETVEEPQEDEHHRLLGTWRYAAVNGVIRVGGGVPDLSGEPVNIVAETPGWYVFVWKFAGDDRVMQASSAYNDAWERTRVVDVQSPRKPSIVTQVNRDKVFVGEPFKDTATITGFCDAGSYVTFSAYQPVEEGVVPGMNEKLLDEARVDVDCTSGRARVDSPEVQADSPGIVYWKATLWSSEGDVLADHELGVDGEQVVVDEKEQEEKEEPAPLAKTGVSLFLPLVLGLGALGTGLATNCLLRRRQSLKSR